MAIFHTLGLSNHKFCDLLIILRKHGITAVADVRSPPSGFALQNHPGKPLQMGLAGTGIRYLFLGDTLGDRPSDPACFEQGRVDFDRVRATESFNEGIARLRRGALDFRICLLGIKPDPLECHRAWLICQSLHDAGATVRHILRNSDIELHDALLVRAVSAENRGVLNGSIVANELMATAHRQGARIAYCTDPKRGKDGRNGYPRG